MDYSLDSDTVWVYSIIIDAPLQEELDALQAAGRAPQADSVVHWQSAYGLIIIETRAGQVYVNGVPVEPFRREGASVDAWGETRES